MQICVRDHVEVHPQKKKEVLYFVKKKLGEIGESSDQLSESESYCHKIMLSSKMYVYGITKNRLEIYFELA